MFCFFKKMSLERQTLLPNCEHTTMQGFPFQMPYWVLLRGFVQLLASEGFYPMDDNLTVFISHLYIFNIFHTTC